MDIEEKEKNLRNTIKSNLISFGLEAKIIEQITEQLFQDILDFISEDNNKNYE